MPPHHHVEAQMQQSKTITNTEKHEQEEPTKTIATKTIANMTGSQPPMGTTHLYQLFFYRSNGRTGFMDTVVDHTW